MSSPRADGDMGGVCVSGSISLARYLVELAGRQRHGESGAGGLVEDNPVYPNPWARWWTASPMGTLGDELHHDHGRAAACQRRLSGLLMPPRC
ncbi:MAG: hypothetical protein M5R42_05530 [Rhodocyclaceae bacterium]|nr:hypothetical protein [Rhodocyclaceae bacterium]